MRKLLFGFFLLLYSTSYGQVLSAPFTNIEAGLYTEAVSLSFFHPEDGVSIFYTLDGSEPNVTDNLYSEPITLGALTEETDVYAIIPTNPSLTYPYGTYSAGRASSRGWVPPYSDGHNINVVRFRAFKPGFAPSPVQTKTFIVTPAGTDLYSTPIISINMDYDDIFSDENGIYVYGNHPDGNYEQKGKEWERIMSFEYFDESGQLAITQNCRTRIHGGGSRHAS